MFLDPPYKDETSGGVREQCPNTDFHNGIWKTQIFFRIFCWKVVDGSHLESQVTGHRVENQKGKCHPLEI